MLISPVMETDCQEALTAQDEQVRKEAARMQARMAREGTLFNTQQTHLTAQEAPGWHGQGRHADACTSPRLLKPGKKTIQGRMITLWESYANGTVQTASHSKPTQPVVGRCCHTANVTQRIVGGFVMHLVASRNCMVGKQSLCTKSHREWVASTPRWRHPHLRQASGRQSETHKRFRGPKRAGWRHIGADERGCLP